MKLISLFFAAVLVLTAGCAKNNNDIQDDSLARIKAVSLEFKTTTTDGVNVKWENGDRIALYAQGGTEEDSMSAVYQTSLVVPSSEAAFTLINDVQPQRQEGVYLAACPASALTAWGNSPDRKCTMELPANQKVSAPGWDNSASLMAAASATDEFVFSHCVAYVKFTITEESPSIVSFSAASGNEAMASGVNVTYAEDNTISVTPLQDNQATKATLAMEDGGAFVPGTYYLAILPKTYAGGFEFTFTDTDGQTIVKKVQGEVEMAAGVVADLGQVKKHVPGSSIDPLKPFELFTTLRVSLVGDSISTFDGYIPSDFNAMHSEGNASYYPNSALGVTDVSQTYWYKLIYDKMEKAALEMNNSFRGTMVTRRLERNYANCDYCARVANWGLGNPDVILIHGGTNDSSKHSASFVNRPGTYRADMFLSDAFLSVYDATEGKIDGNAAYEKEPYKGMAPSSLPTDEEFNKVYAAAEAADTWEEILALEDRSFIHAYVKLLNMIHFKHPQAKVVLIIGDGLTKRAQEAIIKIAGHYDAKYGYKYVNFFPLAANITPSNNVHPDAAGHAFMANTIYNQLESYLNW